MSVLIQLALVVILFVLPLFGYEVPENERAEYFFEELAVSLEKVDDYSPVLKSKNYDVEIAQFDKIIAQADRDFRIGVNVAGQSIHEDRPNEDFYHRYRTLNQVFIKKPVFHWGALKAREEIAKLKIVAAQKSLGYQKRVLHGDLREAYLRLITLKYRSDLANEQLKLAEQNANSANERLKVGLGSSLTVEEARAEKLNREILYSETLISLQREKTNFVSLSGYSLPLNLEISQKFTTFCSEYIPNTDFQIFAGSLSSEELELLKLQSSIEDQEDLVAGASIKHKINLTSSFFQDQVDLAEGGQNLDRNNFLIGLEANWLIWDAQKSKAQKKAALARKGKVDHQIETKKREQREMVNSMVSELRSIKERILLTRKLIAVAQSRFDKSSTELSLNRISPNEHFSSVVSLDLAKLNNLEMVCRYMVLIDQYELALGLPNSDDMTKVGK